MMEMGTSDKNPKIGTVEAPAAPMNAGTQRIYLLSPANAAGVRGQMLFNEAARFEIAQRFRRQGVPIGELFTFISGLYFRGKVAYAEAFAAAPENVPGAFVITACWGLQPLHKNITHNDLQEMLQVPIELENPAYRIPLEREALALLDRVGRHCEIILLGSIATPKYLDPLLSIFGERLLFPAEFVGRGDMSRGGLMLRHARSGVHLNYIAATTAMRRGTRPPKLPKLTVERTGEL